MLDRTTRQDWTLRPATAEDSHAIARVWHQGWRDGHVGHVPDALLPHRGLELFRSRVPARIDRIMVATFDSQLVGFVSVDEDELEQLFVTEALRGRGVAAALLAAGEGAIAKRFEVAWLAVVVGNMRARRFYERLGWQEVGLIDYEAEIEGGTLSVPSCRYEKRLALTERPRST